MLEERYALPILEAMLETETDLIFYDKEGDELHVLGQLISAGGYLVRLATVDLRFDTTKIEAIVVTNGLIRIRLAKPTLT